MKTIKRFTFQDPAADSEPTVAIQLAGFARFTVLDIHASFYNGDLAPCQTAIRMGNQADTYWHIAPGVTVDATSSCNLSHFIGAAGISPLVAGGTFSAPIAPITWDMDIAIRLTTTATAYSFTNLSILVEYDTE